MNPENNVIILQGKPKDRCSDIAKLENKHNGKLQVTFNDGMTYLYNQSSVAWYTTPKDIDLSKYYIYYNGEIVDNYLQVFNFDNIYYKFKFANGRYGTYLKKDLVFQKNCNEEDTVKSLLGYLKQVAIIVQDNDFLINQLESIDVKEGSILYKYATATAPTETKDVFDVIYPFGIYLEYEALAKLLEKLNDERVNDIRKKQEKLKAAVNIEMWDAHDGIYYSQDISMFKTDCSVKGVVLHSGMATHWHTVPLKIRFWGCFLPMYAGICTENQAERICNHLTENDDIFATYGIRTLARNEKMYSLEKSAGNPSNWLGAIWVIANYCVYKGLVRYNKIELANKLRSATLDLLSRSLTEYGDFFESYHPDTGAPFMHAGFLSHNLPIVDML